MTGEMTEMNEQIRTLTWEADQSKYLLRMLSRHCIEGVVDARYSVHDRQGAVIYDVSGYVSLEKWCRTRELNARELKWILGCLVSTLRGAETCLVEPGAFILSPDWIYLNFNRSEVGLCVRPEEGDWQSELKLTARLILEAIDYEEEDCVKLAYEFYHLCMREGLLADDMAGMLEGGRNTLFGDEPEDERLPETGAGSDWINIPENELLPEIGEEKSDVTEDRGRILLRRAAIIAAAVLLLIAVWRYAPV